MKKILVAAKEIRLNKGSEGICSAKFISALVKAGHEVVCLTSDDLTGHDLSNSTLPWLDGVKVKHVNSYQSIGLRTRLSQVKSSLVSKGEASKFLGNKFDAACKYATGYDLETWRDIELWQTAIRQEVETERPDLIFVRGAGWGFEPHMAMLGWNSPVPWIANYHDPFPSSLYPEPYRYRIPVISERQESLHRKILANADVLTFPSRRLMKWVLKDSLTKYQRKAVVVPHLASEFDALGPVNEVLKAPPPNRDDFNIIHSGTVLDHRDPQALLNGFGDFINQDDEKLKRARLIFVGRIHPNHTKHAIWSQLLEKGNVVHFNQRMSYNKAMELTLLASAVVILEANAPESPFFPAKLADYLLLRKPILALSPEQSATADILGTDYKLRVAPNDKEGVTKSLNTLWEHWRTNRLDELVPAKEILDQSSEEKFHAQLEYAFNIASAGRAA